MESSTLPEANRAGCPGRRLVWNRLRKSCYVMNMELPAAIINLHKLRKMLEENRDNLRVKVGAGQ